MLRESSDPGTRVPTATGVALIAAAALLSYRVVEAGDRGWTSRHRRRDRARRHRDRHVRGSPAADLVRPGLSDWLDELERGLNTDVGERGGSLSVGEQQLVTLVRAALADPEVLVLDEPTSAVDPATEVRISRTLRQLTTGRTDIAIAHRMSAAEAANRIVVFDNRELVEDGTHEEMVDRGAVHVGLHGSWIRGTSTISG